jgi:hypothetical protein
VLALFGPTPWGKHVGLLLVNAATDVLLFLLARRLLGAGVAATAFAVLSLDRWIMGVFAHATHFVLLPALGGLLMLLRATDTSRARDFLAAGVLLGTAVLMKQQAAAFVLLGAGLVAWHELRRSSGRAGNAATRTAVLLGGAALPFAILCAVLAGQGVLGKFWFWTIVYARKYVTQIPASAVIPLFLLGWQRIIVATVLLWWLAAFGAVTLFVAPFTKDVRAVIGALTAASLVAVMPGFYFQQHYFILLLPAAALLIAAAIVSLRFGLERGLSRNASRALAVSVFLVAVGAYVLNEREYLWSMPTAQLSRQVYGANPLVEAENIGRYIRAHTAPDDRIAVLGSEPEIYFYAGRKSATGYIYTYALMERQPYSLQMQHEVIREIEAAHPAYLVFVPIHTSWLPMRTEEPIPRWSERYIRQAQDSPATPRCCEP